MRPFFSLSTRAPSAEILLDVDAAYEAGKRARAVTELALYDSAAGRRAVAKAAFAKTLKDLGVDEDEEEDD